MTRIHGQVVINRPVSEATLKRRAGSIQATVDLLVNNSNPQRQP